MILDVPDILCDTAHVQICPYKVIVTDRNPKMYNITLFT
jgi:hypothetical protein